MLDYLHFVIPGIPIPKSRPRFCKVKGKSVVYDNQKEKSDYARLLIKKQLKLQVLKPYYWDMKCKVKMIIFFYFPFTPSLMKKNYRNAIDSSDIYNHIIKPDLSNLIKFYEDVMNLVVYKDDSQIVEICSRKMYSENERTEIYLQCLPDFEIKPTDKLLDPEIIQKVKNSITEAMKKSNE